MAKTRMTTPKQSSSTSTAGTAFTEGLTHDAAVLDLLAAYKRRVAGVYRPLPAEDLAAIPQGPLLVSRKLDGELWFVVKQAGVARLVNPRGRTLSGAHPILARAAALPDGVVLAGELHSAPADRRERVGDVASCLAGGQVDRLHFTAFDVVTATDGAEPARHYGERLAQLEHWLSAEPGSLRAVATEHLPDTAALRQHYQAVVGEGGAEGLVVRAATGVIYKVKPVIDLDAVVIGFTEKAAEPGHVRSLLLGLRHPDGRVQLLGSCGTVGTTADRRVLFDRLVPRRCPSSVRQASEGGGLYAFVAPHVVVAVRVTDLQAERSDGSVIVSAVLTHDGTGWSGLGLAPCPRLIHPVFDRIRDDKEAAGADVRFAQVDGWLASARDTSHTALTLPASRLVRRAVWTKAAKGQLAVRKLVVWKTNKEQVDPTFPAFVVHWTDYSAGRANPLDREVRVAPSEAEALRLADALVAEHIKKGWELADGPAGT